MKKGTDTAHMLFEQCYQIELSGKKPSVATLKKVVSSDYPLKTIIETVTKWNSLEEPQKQRYASPSFTRKETKSTETSQSLEERVTALEAQVSELQQAIQHLKQSHT